MFIWIYSCPPEWIRYQKSCAHFMEINCLRPAHFRYLCQKLRCRAWCGSRYVVFSGQHHALGYASHASWLRTQVKWIDAHEQHIFQGKSCLHGSCASCYPVNPQKWNCEQLNFVQDLTGALQSNRSIHPWCSTWPITIRITRSTSNSEIWQIMLQHNLPQEYGTWSQT
jgi:hypothetical protein